MLYLFMVFSSCTSLYHSEYKKPLFVDKKAIKSTKILHKKLTYISKIDFTIGYQEATSCLATSKKSHLYL